MIEFKTGDIFKEDAEAIVNTVNCVGVMGRGIALQFKKKFPENFKFYKKHCDNKAVFPGKMLVFNAYSLINPKFIINFPTKKHWRGKSYIKYIEDGLEDLIKVIKENEIKSIAIPPLGCGLGGLNWKEVSGVLIDRLSFLKNVKIIIFTPKGAPLPEEIVKYKNIPKMTPARAVLIVLMKKYLEGLIDPFVTLLEIQKLMYFMQETGENLRLIFKKAYYGPYAENLSHLLNEIEGYFIIGYADGGDDPKKKIFIKDGVYEKAIDFLNLHKETQGNLNKVTNLVEGFESPFGLELLSTVHWILKTDNLIDIETMVDKVYSWNKRKKQFTHKQILLAYNVLKNKNWI